MDAKLPLKPKPADTPPAAGGPGRETELRPTRAELGATVAELRRSNEELQRTNEELIATLAAAKGAAKEANDAKEDFVAAVSHELRTPLAAMLLWSKMLAEETRSLSPDQVKEGLEAIKKCAEEQRELIEALMDAARRGGQVSADDEAGRNRGQGPD